MRLTLSRAVLLGLVAALPFSHAYPYGTDLARRDHATGLVVAEISDDLTLGRGGDEDLKRRYVLPTVDPRGIPSRGKRPPVKPGKDTDIPTPGGKPGGKPGGSKGDHGAGAGHAGSASKFDDDNLEKARAKGETLSKNLDAAIFNNAAAPERKDLAGLGYQFRTGKKVPTTDKYLDDLNIKVTDKSTWVMRGTYRTDTGTKDDILETVTDTSQGTIVVKNSWKFNDQEPPKATWTDMMHDHWMFQCESTSKDPKSLKYVVRDTIQDYDTVDISGITLNTHDAISAVFEKLGADETKMLTIDAKSSNADVKASYELLSAQTHVARVLQWLRDRHADLGDKKIAKLHVFHEEHPAGYNMVIELA